MPKVAISKIQLYFQIAAREGPKLESSLGITVDIPDKISKAIRTTWELLELTVLDALRSRQGLKIFQLIELDGNV